MVKDLWKIAESTKYPVDAFIFLQKGLDHAVRGIHGDPPEDLDEDDDEQTASRHVSGRQLCHGLRDYAVEQYGLMARTVLARWRIFSCEDFGRIIFAMVDAGIMRKTDDDSIADFLDAYDFEDAFSPALQLSEK